MKLRVRKPTPDLVTALVLACIAIGIMTGVTFLKHPHWFVGLIGLTAFTAIFLGSILRKDTPNDDRTE